MTNFIKSQWPNSNIQSNSKFGETERRAKRTKFFELQLAKPNEGRKERSSLSSNRRNRTKGEKNEVLWATNSNDQSNYLILIEKILNVKSLKNPNVQFSMFIFLILNDKIKNVKSRGKIYW